MHHLFTNIKIDGSDLGAATQEANEYEEEICKLLLQINQKKTGKTLLLAIGRITSKKMTIKPETDQYPPDEVNAGEEPVGEQHSRKKWKAVDRLERIMRGRGTGFGSDTLIYITPKDWINGQLLADDVLVHEMVHGFRGMAGKVYKKRVPFQKTLAKDENGQYINNKRGRHIKIDSYTNMEEWFAVLVQNIYRSECRRLLRLEYSMSFGNYTEEEFIKKGMNRTHMRQFRREHREFFRNLRNIEVPFNPTRLILDL